ncbi:hypothetical protein GCM10010123_35550 [Pilimelia anulata]|uniref:BD-FAE-like domain-containing protein n=1 Tax=Pilimelia anulata TaxID=53371 RepID=A0A8J3BBB2_9ACTN|nr:alpha/beta fold hydrolase [Pilimelia anulata]GGK02511.1 hypothetical protein GCM10010123_35550 [Pilimelia anulata]
MDDPRSVLTRPAPPPDHVLSYDSGDDRVLDLRLPAAPRGRPLVVLLHGGFWRPEYDRAHVGPLAADLAARGWPVAVPEYRRTGWDDTAADVTAALAAAADLAAPHLAAAGATPPPGVLLIGHSAGGHLALWAGGAAPAVRGVLALAPVTDLAEAYRLDLDDGAVAALLGGGPDEVPDRYAEAEPLSRPPVRATLIHGTLDEQVPPAQSRTYAATRSARLVEIPDAEHYALIDPLSPAWPTVLTELTTLTTRP